MRDAIAIGCAPKDRNANEKGSEAKDGPRKEGTDQGESLGAENRDGSYSRGENHSHGCQIPPENSRRTFADELRHVDVLGPKDTGCSDEYHHYRHLCHRNETLPRLIIVCHGAQQKKRFVSMLLLSLFQLHLTL